MPNNLSSKASNIAIGALQSIPFENLIGGPLEASVHAQSLAAQSTIDFIQAVGLNDVPLLDANGNQVKDKDGNIVTVKEAVYVSFQFIQGGRVVRLNIPLLTIVPIPYIAINTIDINFKANITSASTVSDEESTSNSFDQSVTTKIKRGWNCSRNNRRTTMSAQISSKKDSKSTQESNYSVEYTMDIAVHASQDSMPAGMAKVLELVGSAMDLCSTDGELNVNGDTFIIPKDATGDEAKVRLEASYKTPNGVLTSTGFKLHKMSGSTDSLQNSTGHDKYKAWYLLTEGTYTLKTDDDLQTLDITVTKEVETQIPQTKSNPKP
jgi:hypothetical protein